MTKARQSAATNDEKATKKGVYTEGSSLSRFVAPFCHSVRIPIVGFSYKKQQRCEIFVELPISAIYKGAAHRNIKI
jgi:hypothetical protein